MVKRRILPGLLIIALILALSGCGQQSDSHTLKLKKTVSGLTITLQTNKLPGNNPVVCTLSDAAGNPLSSAEVKGQLSMPSMTMKGYPMPIEFKHDDKGQYTGIAQIKHGGKWRIDLTISTSDQKLDNIPFDMEIETK